MSEPLFKINWDDKVKTRGKYFYVTTTPPHPNGEVRPDRNKKYVYLHIALKELELGRFLKKGEEVHHKDNNALNNRLNNLELTTHSEHQIEHAKKRKFWEKSPRTKPRAKKASIVNVIGRFLTNSTSD